MRLILGLTMMFLSACATDPVGMGLIDAWPKHAPGAPEIKYGKVMPEVLQGSWLAQRKNGDISVWSRVSFSDPNLQTTQIWGDQYNLGAFEERVISLRENLENETLNIEIVLEVQRTMPSTKSFIDNYRKGDRKECRLNVDLKSKPLSLTRYCGASIKGEAPSKELLSIFYKT